MPQKGRGIFMVYVDIDAKDVQEFNERYNKEHLPELLSVPGILSAARYEAVKGGPQYLACYELDSVAVMQTPAFTNRPRTLWGQKVSPSVIGTNLTRIVGEQIYPDGIEMPERGMAPVLQIGRMSVPAEVDAEWNAWYSGEYVPGYRKVPGVIYARVQAGPLFAPFRARYAVVGINWKLRRRPISRPRLPFATRGRADAYFLLTVFRS